MKKSRAILNFNNLIRLKRQTLRKIEQEDGFIERVLKDIELKRTAKHEYEHPKVGNYKIKTSKDKVHHKSKSMAVSNLDRISRDQVIIRNIV